jgi:hypothetical protein
LKIWKRHLKKFREIKGDCENQNILLKIYLLF